MSHDSLAVPGDKGSLSVIEQLQIDELKRLLPFCLFVFALFSLGYAVWHYRLEEPQFALILGASGLLSVLLLVLYQLTGVRLLVVIKAIFCTQLMAMTFFYILTCKVDDTGVLGALCVMPGLVFLCGKRVAIWLLAVNVILMAAISKGWLFGSLDAISEEMWTAFLGSYIGLGLFLVVVDHLRDLSREKLVMMSQQFHHTASQDQLTGLPNRKELERLLGSCLNSYHLSREPFSVILADLDNFKEINEQYGTQFGDQMLKVVSRALQQGLRSDDMAARWGGDQFLILLRGEKIEAARHVAERLRRNVAIQKLTHKDEPVSATISVGVATIAGNETSDELLSSAERGLYQAKHMGKDMVVVA